MRHYLLTLFLLLTAAGIAAQNQGSKSFTVNGTVQTTTGEPLPGANVRLTNNRQSDRIHGMASDAQGAFSITVPQGSYTLEISYMGYSKYVTQVKVSGEVNLPAIGLSEDTQVMDAVVITARTITYHPDGYVAEVSKNPLFRGKDLTDVMKLSPVLYATDDAIQVRGEGVGKLYLNGREMKLYGAALIAYLKTLPASNIKEMEVITSSGVEDDAALMGRSIIRITTINPDTGGMIIASVTGSIGKEKHQLNPFINGQVRLSDKWSVYFNGNTNIYQNYKAGYTHTLFHTTGEERRSHSESKDKGTGFWRGLAGISYDLDKNNQFSIEGHFKSNGSKKSFYDIATRRLEEEYADYMEGYNLGETDNGMTNLSFTYIHTFADKSKLTFKADYQKSTQELTEENLDTYADDQSTRGYNRLYEEDGVILTTQADYERRMKNGRLAFGVKYSDLSVESCTDHALHANGTPQSAGSYNDLYDYGEQVYAAYAKYTFTLKGFSFNTGLRLEHSLVTPESSVNPEGNHRSKYTDLFPQAGISYMLDKERGHNLSLSYRRGIRRPSMTQLNPLVKYVGSYNYSTGNPYLKPNYTDNLSLSATLFNKYNVSLSYRYAKDAPMSYAEQRDGVIYSTYYNGARSKQVNLFADLPLRPVKWWDMKIQLGYDWFKETYGDDKISGSNAMLNFHNDLKLGKSSSMGAYMLYVLPTKGIYSRTVARPITSLKFQHIFTKWNLTASLTFADLFNSFGSSRTRYTYDSFYQKSGNDYNGRNISLSLRYMFKWGKKSFVRRGGIGNAEESGRFEE
ncbi:MAG: TonB-dependent receptor [Bacteroides sp.]|nr:TonB-dependent receptor [Bacteroides sp.]